MAKEETEKKFKVGWDVMVDDRHSVVEDFHNKHYICCFANCTVDAYTEIDLKPAKLKFGRKLHV